MVSIKKVSELKVAGVNYFVVTFIENGKRWYGTIDEQYLENGRLKQELNGIQMLIEDTVVKAVAIRNQVILYQQILRETRK